MNPVDFLPAAELLAGMSGPLVAHVIQQHAHSVQLVFFTRKGRSHRACWLETCSLPNWECGGDIRKFRLEDGFIENGDFHSLIQESKRHTKEAVSFVVIVVVVVGLFGGYAFVQRNAPQQVGSGSNSTLKATNVVLQISNEYFCGVGQTQCQPLPALYLYGTLSVNASSPLSCLDTYVAGMMQDETCWNLTSAGFPFTSCSGSGSQQTCTTGYRPNNNTLTSRVIPLTGQMSNINGTNDGPVILVGATYPVLFVAHFEDGSSSTISLTAVVTRDITNS